MSTENQSARAGDGDLPPLPATDYRLFYEDEGDEDHGDEGYQEVLDEPGYTAKEMRDYARAAIAAATAAAPAGWSDAKQAQFNDWFLGLPKPRRNALIEDKWMLAAAAFEAGKSFASPAEPTDAMVDAGKRALHNVYHKGAREKVIRIFKAMHEAGFQAPATADGSKS